jgi:hypothetical protein
MNILVENSALNRLGYVSYDLTDLEHNATNQINPFHNKSHPSISHNSVMSELTVLARDPLHKIPRKSNTHHFKMYIQAIRACDVKDIDFVIFFASLSTEEIAKKNAVPLKQGKMKQTLAIKLLKEELFVIFFF